MILLLHNRYRVPGGEERAVEDLAWLIREHLDEDVEVLERDSSTLSQRQAAEGLLRGGLGPEEVRDAVRRTGARVVHAHNVNPTLGWRALAAAREAGARVVLHLHNYRLVCAVGTCFTRGEDCTRCHGRNTLPGVRLNCRGGSLAESAAYAASLALWQERLAAQADRFLVPSAFALQRLRALGAPVDDRASVLWSVQREFADALARGRRPPRPLRRAAEPREGRRRRRRGLPRRRAPARGGGRGPGGRRAPGARRRRRRALHRHGGRARRSPSCAATPPSPSSPPATRRSSRSPRSRRWPRACPSSRPARAAWPSSCPEEGLYPPGDVAALAARAPPPVGRRGGGQPRAGVVRERCAPEQVARALAAVYA